MKFYTSLTGPLLGLYYPLPDVCDTDTKRRIALATSKLRGVWCSIYTQEEAAEQVVKWGGMLLPDEFARKLDYDHFAVMNNIQEVSQKSLNHRTHL